MKKAAAYIRVSTDRQTELSPESQLNEIRAFAKRNDMILLEDRIYRDDGISGTSIKRRNAFLDMIKDAEQKPAPFDCVIVWKFSRFARSRQDSIVYKTMLRKNGVQVVSVSEPLPDDDISTITEAMIEAMDEYYSKRLSGEVSRGMKEKVMRGLPVSVAPVGYKMVDGKYEPSAEADFIRGIFADFVAGEGYKNLAIKYTDMGLRTTRGNPLDNRFIEYVLRNPVYVGKIRWCTDGRGASRRDYDNENNIIVDGQHQPLIDVETWDAAQSRIAELRRLYRKHQRPCQSKEFMLKGLLRCSACGSTLVHQSTKCPALQCHSYSRGVCRVSHGIALSRANNAVIAGLENILAGDKVVFDADAMSKVQNQKNADFDLLIKNEQIKLDRLTDAYLSEVFDLDTFKLKRSQIEQNIANLKSELKKQIKLNAPKQDTDSQLIRKKISSVLQVLKDVNSSEEAKSIALRSILTKIVYNKEKNKLQLFFYL